MKYFHFTRISTGSIPVQSRHTCTATVQYIPVQSGLLGPYVPDHEVGGDPVLGLEGCPPSEVAGTGPDPCE